MLADYVFATSSTMGTGTYDLDPVTGENAGLFQTFVEGIGGGNIASYRIVLGEEFEKGYGIVAAGDPDTLTRLFITASSNGGAAVNWGPGVKSVYCFPTSDLIRAGAMGPIPTAGGTANAPTLAYKPGLLGLMPGMGGRFYAAAENTGPVTLAIDGLSPTTLRRADGSECLGGAIRDGVLYEWYAETATQLRIRESLDGWTPWARQTGAGASYDFPIPPWATRVRLEFEGVKPSVDAALFLRVATDGVPNFITGASDYGYALGHASSAGGGTVSANGGALDRINLSAPVDSTSQAFGSLEFDPDALMLTGEVNCVDNTGQHVRSNPGGYIALMARATHVRLSAVSATFTAGRATLSVRA